VENTKIHIMGLPSSNNYRYNNHLASNANDLRKDKTKAEACLWKYVLKAGGMKGFTFRRQRPVLQYIADFMCKELQLIVEVDGITHTYEEVTEKDNRKQADLETAGFTDEEVLHHMNSVNQEIENQVIRIMETRGISPRIRRRQNKS
jgi:very-short-patch-repair endonuclease